MIEIIERKKDKSEVNTMSPLNWAYIGDNIFELYIRMNLINNTRLKPHNLHVEAVKHVRASSQANLLNKIEENLTDEEKDIVRRGRNAQNHHVPKNSTVEEYSHATAFEALIGYLYLSNNKERLDEIMNIVL